ncbi:ead/Ea22-like family protein [Salmonella enterica]|nr:ead/Ea22-like family protein [Salmonella enterica]EAR9944193.1 ead/Ea22-like family protein [Salmonella enterica]EDQ7361992.1 ead/Ea22-like family protein [Salmonella enterica subsp. enterica serovar Carrau]
MQQVKIYTASPSDLSPPVQSESFCVDLVLASDYRELEAKCAALAAENSALKKSEAEFNEYCRRECEDVGDTWEDDFTETPATDALLAEVRAQAHKEGAYFVANRMLAAWDAGFIDDTAKNAADIARMILTSTEFMADAPEGDFDRSFADGVLEGIAAQLRKGVQS